MDRAANETREAFIASVPKAELHLHIEGSLEPEMMFELAKRNGVDLPYASVEEVREAYQFSNLQEFLDLYYLGMQALVEEQDFYDLTIAYLERVHRDNVRHVEIFFDPQGHTERGIAFETVITGILRALDEGKARLGISYKLIMCFLRHLSEEEAFATLEEAMPWLDRIDGVGLDSSEVGHPPEKFARVFAKCRELGLKLVAHAGEEGPPEYVWQALDVLEVDRIDHGNRALEDTALLERIVREGHTLTVCPLSNLKLCVIDHIAKSPVRTMLESRVKATVNSDDPSYFGGYINDNYRAVAEALDLSIEDIATLAANSFEGSFLDEAQKAAFVEEVHRVASSV
ncbi:adenosine deaminase [Erythrobacter sp. KY5]|uniref:adenosine deaminase n=1 Tax=Erythrobacter sp. KY5 TaxID=2011159 RepID=UPI000DBF15E2|nr:adenosine deaminase [Erythrobacter sp. KY5]AWW75772.1 adenosine deaminase [Erythrobacter sp. KY5]